MVITRSHGESRPTIRAKTTPVAGTSARLRPSIGNKSVVQANSSLKNTQISRAKSTPVAAASSSQRSSIGSRSVVQTNSSFKDTQTNNALLLKNIAEKVALLEQEVDTLKKCNTELVSQVSVLKEKSDEQQKVIQAFQLQNEALEGGISLEQQSVNTNVIIRGVQNAPNENVTAIYENICEHLGIAEEQEFKSATIEVAQSSENSSKQIRVKFSSIETKRKFLQTRRIKKDIFPREIKVEQESQRPIFISEELTKKNQALLYKARSLRQPGGFQFVWSNNGQILARRKRNAKVVRIANESDIEALKASLVENDTTNTRRSPRSTGAAHQCDQNMRR